MAVLEHALMQSGKEVVKVHAALVWLHQGVKETLQQPTFASPDCAIQVQATGLTSVEGGGLGGHLFDNVQLALA
ncbi:hypothetical protein D3C75_1031420 [compost metagenome]|jgi:hypothetical protein